MAEGALLVAFITLQRLAELLLSRRNTQRLLAEGGVEFGRSHYPWMVALHSAWLLGLWWFGHARPVDPLLLGVFILLQAGRLWVIASLGRRWTTRIIVPPGAPLVASGPYRWLKHPNYLIVALEVAVVPLALGLPVFAAVFTLLNACILYLRIRAENAALARAAEPDRAAQTLANESRSL
ncbi:MAG TPA: isoprenylcysteine carboxylmethyltransferase family protein [Xanthobacteraceae bacterium]|nr:isoprenylcysteine carboxylmethyltransferase family protein [Xanthobacteraceae bacterium]